MGEDSDKTQPETNPGSLQPLSVVTSLSAVGGTLQAGTAFGPYHIVRKLGQGGMGMVYEARDITLDRRVAVKVMRPELVANPDFKTRFLREARAAAQIMHPNVVVIHQAGDLAGTLFMAFEYVPGGDLASRLAKGPLPTADAVRLIIECASGLQAIHQAGMIHRDIKPQNIFIDEQGRAKLGDLGLARTTHGDDRVTMTGMAMGTPAFMSPEQIEGDADIDIRSDIHALGATLFNALTGHPPFTGQTPFSITHKVMTTERPLLRSLDPQLSERLQRIVLKAMARDRDQRFKDPQELIEALRGRAGSTVALPGPAAADAGATGHTVAGQATVATSVDGMGSPTAPTVLSQVRPPPLRPQRRSGVGILLGLLALFAVSAGLWLALHRSTPQHPAPAVAAAAGTASAPAAPPAGEAAPSPASVQPGPGTPPPAAPVPASAPVPATVASTPSAGAGGTDVPSQAAPAAAPAGAQSAIAAQPPAPAAAPAPDPAPPPATTAASMPTPAAVPDEHELRLMVVEDQLGVDRSTAERVQELFLHLRQKAQQLTRDELPPREKRQQMSAERARAWQKASLFLMPAQLDAFTKMINSAMPRARAGLD